MNKLVHILFSTHDKIIFSSVSIIANVNIQHCGILIPGFIVSSAVAQKGCSVFVLKCGAGLSVTPLQRHTVALCDGDYILSYSLPIPVAVIGKNKSDSI